MALIVSKPKPRGPDAQPRKPREARKPLTAAQMGVLRQGLWDLKNLAEIAAEIGTHEKALAADRRDILNGDPALRAHRRLGLSKPVPAKTSEGRLEIIAALRRGLSDSQVATALGCSRTWVNHVRVTDCPETRNDLAYGRLIKRIERGIIAGWSRKALVKLHGATPELVTSIEARMCDAGEIIPAKASRGPDAPPEMDPTEKHARALIREGGFWSLSERIAINGQPIACLPLVPPPRELMEAFR